MHAEEIGMLARIAFGKPARRRRIVARDDRGGARRA
jgi:hypothetical protein